MRPLTLVCMFMLSHGAVADVVVEALLPGFAVLQVDGQRVTLRNGQQVGDVRLIAADAKSALVEINGVQRRLAMSGRISTRFSEPAERSVTIPRNAQMQYAVTAEINGVRLPVIVDTGANIVAMNSAAAAAIGLAADAGEPSQVQTAGSLVPARRVVLDSVVVGGIRVDAVAGTVMEGDYPVVVLLGMSFLQHVELEEKAGVLTLRARW